MTRDRLSRASVESAQGSTVCHLLAAESAKGTWGVRGGRCFLPPPIQWGSHSVRALCSRICSDSFPGGGWHSQVSGLTLRRAHCCENAAPSACGRSRAGRTGPGPGRCVAIGARATTRTDRLCLNSPQRVSSPPSLPAAVAAGGQPAAAERAHAHAPPRPPGNSGGHV